MENRTSSYFIFNIYKLNLGFIIIFDFTVYIVFDFSDFRLEFE